MSNRAPDFSATFEIVDDQLEDAERRLKQRRMQQDAAGKPAKKLQEAQVPQASAAVLPESEPAAAKPQRAKRPKGEGAKRPELVKREVRRNLTLKVLEENETRFNQLFHRLQLAGDGRRKQDLADEALGLLFAKYKRLSD